MDCKSVAQNLVDKFCSLDERYAKIDVIIDDVKQVLETNYDDLKHGYQQEYSCWNDNPFDDRLASVAERIQEIMSGLREAEFAEVACEIVQENIELYLKEEFQSFFS